MNTDDDRQLLLATHAGDEPAARALWARHAPRLIAYGAAILPPGISADDVVQTALCSVLSQSRRTLAAVECVPAWLTRLVRNTALNAVRAARRERRRERGAAEVRTRGARRPTPAPDAGDELRTAVDALPRRLREVVVLRHVGGLTFDQVALALGANRNTVAARYRTALARLRVAMGRGTADENNSPVQAAEVTHG